MNQKENRITLHGDGGELFGIYIVNVLLTIVTFGIYSFWAQVKVTKYFYNETEFLGQRFDYHATGKERFIGFLKAAAVLGAVLLVFAGLNYLFVELLGLAFMGVLLLIVLYVGWLAAIPWLLVAQRRYHLSRSSWSGIRFRFVGKPGDLAREFIVGALLTTITLGIYMPWFMVKMSKFFLGNSQLGNQKFGYDGDGGELFKIFILGYLLTLVTLGIYGSWWIAKMERYSWEHTTFSNNRFRSDIQGGDIFVTTIVVFLMVAFSLGIAFPWAILKIQRLYMNAIVLEGEVDLKAIQASADAGASAFADGVSDVADAADAVGGFL